MRRVVIWDSACNFNTIILKIFNCLITSASTLVFIDNNSDKLYTLTASH